MNGETLIDREGGILFKAKRENGTKTWDIINGRSNTRSQLLFAQKFLALKQPF